MEYDNKFKRELAILEAALPYVTPQSKHAIEMLIKADALINLANEKPDMSIDIEAAEHTENNPYETLNNISNMLLSIEKFLTPREADLIHTMINFMNANKLFRNYQDFAKKHSNDKSDDINKTNNIMQSFLLSQLNPEQKTAFEQMQNIMYNE